VQLGFRVLGSMLKKEGYKISLGLHLKPFKNFLVALVLQMLCLDCVCTVEVLSTAYMTSTVGTIWHGATKEVEFVEHNIHD